MMRKPLLLLAMLLAGCQQAADVAPVPELATDEEVEITTWGRNSDCRMAQVVVSDPAQVHRVLGLSGHPWGVYVAYQLDTALWVRKNRVLYVRIRKTQPNELVACTARGPGYPSLTVISARIKPGSE